MYLPTMTDEELLRYADQAAATELEKELAKRFKDALDEMPEEDPVKCPCGCEG